MEDMTEARAERETGKPLFRVRVQCNVLAGSKKYYEVPLSEASLPWYSQSSAASAA
jgi:hypothetical protein